MHRLQGVGVGACGCKGRVEEAVTAALADLCRYRGVEDGVHGQLQRVLTLTAVSIGVGIRVGA